MLGAPYTGGVMNPARAFGPALAARQWAYQGVYWVGPLAGAVAAASLYDLLFRLAEALTGCRPEGRRYARPTHTACDGYQHATRARRALVGGWPGC